MTEKMFCQKVREWCCECDTGVPAVGSVYFCEELNEWRAEISFPDDGPDEFYELAEEKNGMVRLYRV